MSFIVFRHRLLWWHLGCWAFVVSGLVAALSHSSVASELRRTPIARAIQEAAPSIVNIHGRKTLRSGQNDATSGAEREVNGMGTGVVIDERGYILTNFHVVDGVANIQVTLVDDHTVIGRVIGHDTKTDLAVIKIEVNEPLPVIRVGTSNDLMVGESVVAVGNAYGYQHTATQGIISALHRSVQVSDNQKYHDLIQTDASINPGNSGGPLMNVDGDVIAINVAVRVGAQGIGFAIPIDEAMDVAANLMSAERVDHLAHGVVGKTERIDDTPRFLLTSVQKDSPAEVAGLRSGDVITKVDQQPVSRTLDFERHVLGHHAGDAVNVSALRGDQILQFSMKLVELPEQKQPNVNVRAWEVLGMRLETVPSGAFRQITSRYHGGLKVASIRPDGPAAKQGIRPGDILVGIHKWETVSLENVAYIIGSDDVPANQPVKFFIVRGGETLYGTLRLSMNSKR